jgi:hypothetical protein
MIMVAIVVVNFFFLRPLLTFVVRSRIREAAVDEFVRLLGGKRRGKCSMDNQTIKKAIDKEKIFLKMSTMSTMSTLPALNLWQ